MDIGHSPRSKKQRTRLPDVVPVITLKYGIEIECVFELLDQFDAYFYFIKFCSNMNYTEDTKLETIKVFMEIINNVIEKNNINDYDKSKNTDILQNNIYKELNDTESYDTFLKTNLDKLIKTTTNLSPYSKAKEFIEKWTIFLNTALLLIKTELDHQILAYKINHEAYSSYDVINILLNGNKDLLDVYNNFINRFDLTQSKIKLFDSIDNFYTTSSADDIINLLLKSDTSVICHNQLVYKNIQSGEIINYKFLLNNCEFITQPFNSIEEIGEKIALFFDDTVINNSLLNCSKTSQHVHISFNINDRNTRPDIYILLSIVCVCYYFQDEIFKLFLITRSNNSYCSKLNYYITKNNNIINDEENYEKNLENILNIFYTGHISSDNKYYWLNILNLYIINEISRPYTIEFRIKHGSNDVTELLNVCKLYENIIKYSIDILEHNSQLKTISDICKFKDAITEIIDLDKENIFNKMILKDIKDYFTNPESVYVIGLDALNDELLSETLGGKFSKTHKTTLPIEKFINKLETKPIFKLNSFGLEFIGFGLNNRIKIILKNKYLKYKFTTNEITNFLNNNNIYY